MENQQAELNLFLYFGKYEIPLEIEINIKLPDSLNKKTPIHIRYARNGNNISGDVG